jgi:hypothetical protein
MAHKSISIPGGGTSVSQGPNIQVSGLADQPLTVVIRYNARAINERPHVCGVLTFMNVMQYSWVAFGYAAHLTNPNDLQFGLIQITDSGLIESLQRARPLHQHELVDLNHYRLSWNNYGTVDILSARLEINQTDQDCP